MLDDIRCGLTGIDYAGLDPQSRGHRHLPSEITDRPFFAVDYLADDSVPEFDYTIMNGMFTVRHSLDRETMWAFLSRMVGKAFRRSRVGVAFNVMSKHVDWEKDSLFHVPESELDRVRRQAEVAGSSSATTTGSSNIPPRHLPLNPAPGVPRADGREVGDGIRWAAVSLPEPRPSTTHGHRRHRDRNSASPSSSPSITAREPSSRSSTGSRRCSAIGAVRAGPSGRRQP